jgi:hypothetical protein
MIERDAMLAFLAKSYLHSFAPIPLKPAVAGKGSESHDFMAPEEVSEVSPGSRATARPRYRAPSSLSTRAYSSAEPSAR